MAPIKALFFCANLTSFIAVFAFQAAAQSHDNPLRELIRNDWGFDLPISGSLDEIGTRLNPIEIYPSSDYSFSETAFLFVDLWNDGYSRYLQQYHSQDTSSQSFNGAIWRAIEPGLRYHTDSGLHYVFYERKSFVPDDIITEEIKTYFHINGGDETIADLGAPDAWYFDPIEWAAPFQLGWFNYTPGSFVDYTDRGSSSEYDVSVAYDAAGVEATFYVYHEPSVFIASYEGYFVREADKIAEYNRNGLDRDYEFWDQWRWSGSNAFTRLWHVGPSNEEGSLVHIIVLRDYVVKLRITWNRDPFLDDAVINFVELITQDIVAAVE